MTQTSDKRRGETERLILALVQARGPDKTICPSEAARALAGGRGKPDDWREEMDRVHTASRRLASAGEVRLTQGGVEVVHPTGAYRIGPS